MTEKLTKDEQRELRRQQWKEEADKKARDEKIKKYGIWSVVALVLLGVGFIFYKAATSPSASPDQVISLPPVEASDIQTGPKDAKVTLVEYSDFQCPACALNYPIVKQLREEYKERLNFVYRMFPLERVHLNAFVAGQAGYAAYKQGKFWEMEDLLFIKQTDWATHADPKQIFAEYAKQLGLDIAKFEADMTSEESKNFVAKQRDSALTIGVQSTPTFFLNGKTVSPQGYQEFKKLVENALSSK